MNCSGIDALSRRRRSRSNSAKPFIACRASERSPADLPRARLDRSPGERLRRRRLSTIRNAPHDEIARSIRALFATGVTRFYPTVITGAPDDMEAALRNLARAKDSLPEGAAIDGFHVEGPHIGTEDGPRGAHPKRWVRTPDFDEFRRWQDATANRIRIVTLSPEWPEAPRYIERIVAEGRGGLHRPYRGHRRADRRRRFRRRIALHAPRQRRARGDAPPSQLHLGSARRRPPDGGFHRGWHPPRRQLSEGCAARQGHRAFRAGDRRLGARRRGAGPLLSGRAGRGSDGG